MCRDQGSVSGSGQGQGQGPGSRGQGQGQGAAMVCTAMFQAERGSHMSQALTRGFYDQSPDCVGMSVRK